MSTTGQDSNAIRLLPHQDAFADTFFNPKSRRVVLLRGDVGLGKGAALASLAVRLLRERPASRVLFLVPSALRLQFLETLRHLGAPALLVDRYRYRELLDSAGNAEIWPGGTVFVLSQDFAKQHDIRDSLAKTAWELVIADEAHLIKGARAETLRRVGARAERIVLATANPHDHERPEMFPREETTVVEWRRDQVVDHEGNPFITQPRPILHERAYDLNSAELSLWSIVTGLCEMLGGSSGRQGLRAVAIRRGLESSPAALEIALHRLIEGFDMPESTEALAELSEEEMQEGTPDEPDRASAEKTGSLAKRTLQEIEEIDTDSKLAAFTELLSALNRGRTPGRRTCVFTQHLGTLYYLSAELEAHGMPFQLLHGRMSAEERRRSLTAFLDKGGVLVATAIVMTEGLALAEITDLILYDIPGSRNMFQQFLGCLDRSGRTSLLNLHVLIPRNGPTNVDAAPLKLLRDFFGGETTR